MRSYSTFNLNAILFLIALNVLIFIVELTTGGGIAINSPIIPFLGLTPAYFLHQPWTILTNLFVHASWSHIFCNMISLYFLGSFFTKLVREKNFLKVYFAGGLLGNIFFLIFPYIFPRNPYIPGVGASGAIFALGGALAIMTPRVPVFIFPIPIPVPLWIAMVILLVLSFLFSGIAWEAHLGGFVLGLIAGYFFKKKRRAYYI